MSKITDLSRIDRAIADNLSDIRLSFDDYSGIVQDFIVFVTQQMKYDLFGYTKFTLQDFCKSSGRHRQDLALKHPLFKDGRKKAPSVEGYSFETVFDYALIVMMQRNLVFSKSYETKDKDQVISLESIRIISDVRLNVNRKTKEVKLYEVKVSPEMLDGFIKRYYTLDTNAYRIAGKGKGGDNRKALLIYLSRVRHVLFSKGETTTTFPLDVLAQQADLKTTKSFHRKQSLGTILKSLRDKAKFPFDFEFVSSDSYSYEYYVKITFIQVVEIQQLRREHGFYYALIEDLKNAFESKYHGMNLKMKEPFQQWLNNSAVDLDIKGSILKKAHSKFFSEKLTDTQVYHFLKFGFTDANSD